MKRGRFGPLGDEVAHDMLIIHTVNLSKFYLVREGDFSVNL